MLTTSASPPMPPAGCDNSWYMDSGATHQFTLEFGNLSDPSMFTGEEQVMVSQLEFHLLAKL